MLAHIRRTLVLAVLVVLAATHSANAATLGAITGNVLTSSSAPAAGVYVTALERMYEPEFDFEYYEPIGDAVTNASGTYTIPGLPAGSYVVEFWDPTDTWVTEYFDNATHLDEATPVTVTSGLTTPGVNAVLAPASHVTGRVTDPSGLGISDIDVTAWVFDAQWDEWTPWYWSYTDTNGYYDIGGLPAGIYRVEFLDYEGRWQTEYYDNAPAIEQATSVAVGAEAVVSNIDAVLSAASHIAGRVSDPDGAGIADIDVTAFLYDPTEGEWIPSWGSSTDANGCYDIGGLAAGTYRVEFWDYREYWGTTYYNTADQIESADDIVVGSSESVSGIDATLFETARISGKVSSADNRGLEGILVTLLAWDSPKGDWSIQTSTSTNWDGRYAFGDLKYGTYRIEFSDPSGIWKTQYYREAGTSGEATDIVLSRAYRNKTANTALVPIPPPPASLSGTVKSTTGSALPGISVTLCSLNGSTIATQVTAANGTYLINSIPPGTYAVAFSDPARRYVDQFYANASTLSGATPITLAPGEARSGITASLFLGGSISGRVIDEATGGPIDGITVACGQVVPGQTQPGFSNSVRTGADGTYVLSGLPTGMYRVSFWDSYGRYLYEAYDNIQPDDSTILLYVGTQVPVTASTRTPGINAALRKSLSISGWVSGATSNSPAQVCLWRYRATDRSWQPEGSWSVPASGSYRINDLYPGTYRVEFRSSYPKQFYPNWPTLDNALDIVITNTSVTGIDAKLGLGSSISGRITGADGSAVPGARVTAFRQRPGGWEWVPVQSLIADADGNYRFGGFHNLLLASAYRIAAESDMHAGRFWPSGTSAAGSDVITLPAATVRSGVDIQLEPRSTLTHERLAGVSRYETAVRASASAFPTGAPVVVLTTGENWPDALGGNALAAALGGPLLLTPHDVLPASVAAEIKRLGASRVVMLGGEAAVSRQIERSLLTQPGISSVRRIAGSNRYETAKRVASEVIALQGADYDGHAVVVTGTNFPDALAASPVAAANGWPVYLLSKPKLHSGELRATLSGEVRTAVIVGGSNAVAWSTQTTLGGLLGPFTVTRVAGANRYDTSTKVAEYACTYGGLDWRSVALATGELFPDALAAGSLQAKRESVLMLTPAAQLHPDVKATLTKNRAYVERVTYLGGSKAISEAVKSAAAQALK